MTNDQKFELRKQMAEAVRGGKTLSEVARQFRVSIATVARACMEHDVPTSGITHQRTAPAA